MILRIALKEWFQNIVTPRFITGFILCVLLIPFSIVISINEYKSKVNVYESERKQAEQENQAKVYSGYRPVIVKEPTPLSIFARGVSYNLGDRVKILFGDVPMMSEGKAESRDNPFLNRFFTFDFVSVLIIIISLMALLFTYDICTGERETGTLKMMLSNPVSRASILAGKMLGAFFTLMPMLIFSFGLCILMTLFYSDIHFTSSEWLRIGLIFLLSMVFLVLFMVIGLFVSSRVRHSGTGIVVCLVLWVTFLFIIPNLANYSAKSFVKVGSVENLNFNIKDLDKDLFKKAEEYYKNNLSKVDWNMTWMMDGNNDGYMMVAGATKSWFARSKANNEYFEPLRFSYADKKWRFRKNYISRIELQQRIAQYLSFLSPSEIFKESVNRLCATNAESHYDFMDQTRRYREELINYYKQNKLFSSYLYITQTDPKNFMTADEMVNALTKGEIKTLADLNAKKDPWNFKYFTGTLPNCNFNDWKPLDLSQFPKFSYRSADVLQDVSHSLIHIGVLFALALVLFCFSYIAFIRYDVR